MTESSVARIRLLLVDDHEVVRLGLRALFDRTRNIEVVGEAGSVEEAIREAQRLRPEVVLMDFRLPDGSGIGACRDILSDLPATRVLFLTSYPDEEAVLSTVLAGASGYLLKEIGRNALIRAVETVASGQSILDPKVTQPVLKQMHALTHSKGAGVGDTGRDLSPQECRVLDLVAEGKSNKEIASALLLSDKTVKNYLSNAFQKLQVSRRSQAAALYMRRVARRGGGTV